MVLKSVAMFSLYVVPTVLISAGILSSTLAVIAAFLVAGMGIAGIGMGVMHDANHGSYTRRTNVGYVLTHTLDFLGCSSAIWKLQHNVLHHTYTNIHGHDEDIDAPFVLRFSPHHKLRACHRYQQWYVWFFYGILTLYWVIGKDFIKSRTYLKTGMIPNRRNYWLRQLKLIGIKVFYFGYALVLPLLFSPVSAGWIITGFVLMHVLAGIVLSIVFQLAHVMPASEYPQPEADDTIPSSWFTHQLATTSNFAPRNRALFWFLGGLTNQIEHHLFPQICHVHYPNLSRIVERTAKDFGIPYHVHRSFFGAVREHVRMLNILGKA